MVQPSWGREYNGGGGMILGTTTSGDYYYCYCYYYYIRSEVCSEGTLYENVLVQTHHRSGFA